MEAASVMMLSSIGDGAVQDPWTAVLAVLMVPVLWSGMLAVEQCLAKHPDFAGLANVPTHLAAC